MVGATVAMFTIATLEMAFWLLHNLQAFIWYTGPGGAVAEFDDISNWVNVMRTADYVAQTFIGDGIMVGTAGCSMTGLCCNGTRMCADICGWVVGLQMLYRVREELEDRAGACPPLACRDRSVTHRVFFLMRTEQF